LTWQVQWTDRALKDVAHLDQTTRRRIVKGVERFAETGQGDVKRLQGISPDVYRLRVGDWRIFFSKEQAAVLSIQRVRPRGSAYQP
jgi:mRNA interferase RelE/StbE